MNENSNNNKQTKKITVSKNWEKNASTHHIPNNNKNKQILKLCKLKHQFQIQGIACMKISKIFKKNYTTIKPLNVELISIAPSYQKALPLHHFTVKWLSLSLWSKQLYDLVFLNDLLLSNGNLFYLWFCVYKSWILKLENVCNDDTCPFLKAYNNDTYHFF